MCCCSKEKKKSSKCLQHIGMVKTTVRYLKFYHGKCMKKISSKKRKINCLKKKTKRSNKLPKGVIKITISEYRRIGCKCKLLKSVKYKRWSCPKNLKTKKCVNVPESSIETMTTSFRMMIKTTGCKKLMIINRIPTECPPDRTYWTKCLRGKYAFYKMLIQITYKAKNCKCKKSIEKTPTLCKCDKPKIKRICKKSKSLRIQILTTFIPDEHDHKKCMAVQTKQEFKVLCRSHFRFNHKTKCSKHTNMLYIISKAEKREGCQCKKRWRSKPCKCRCPKTKVIKRCRIDNVKEKIITSYILVNCKCKKLVSSHLVTIKCPSKTISHHKCGGKKGKCISELVITSYKSHKCQCKKLQTVKFEKCCCPKFRKRVLCVKGNMVKVFISYKLTKRKCYRRSHHTIKRTHCSSERTIQMVGPCLGKKQKYKVITSVKKDCKCIQKYKFIYQNCLCLKKSAAEIIFLVDQAVSSRFKGYQKMIQSLLARTVSMFPLGKHSYQFALVKYSERPSIVFNLDNHEKHESIFMKIKNIPYVGQKSNLAKALHLTRTKILKRSRPGTIRLIYIISDGINDKTGHSAYQEIVLLKKLGVKVNAVAVKPSIRGMRFLKKLLSSRKSYFWEVKNEKHVKDLPYQMLRTICKKACPIGMVKRSKCSKETNCNGKTYIYTYKAIGKQCLRTITKRAWKCCCPKHSKTYQLCYKNKKLLVKTSWKFTNKECEKSTKKRDISSKMIESCRPKVKRHIGPCKKSNYRMVITVTRKIKNCKCKKNVRKQKVLCRCSGSKNVQVCKKQENLVKIKLYQTLAKDKCIKRRNMSKIPIVCPKSRLETSKCDKITCKRKIQIIRFKVKECKCHHQLKTIKERCCCSRNKETNRECKNNKRFFYTKWNTFNKKLKTCVKKSIRKVYELKCSKKMKTKFGKCNIPYGKVWYKIKQVKWKIIKNCKCIKMVKNSKVPCKCMKGKSFKKCTNGGIWKMYSIKYNLIKMLRGKQLIGKCKKVIKLILERKHKCKREYKRVYSKCLKLNSNGKKYRIVNVSRNIRKNCGCIRTYKKVKELCKCPKGVVINKCIKNKYKVIFHNWFVVMGQGKQAKCILKTKKDLEKIECPKPSIFKGKCSTKSQKHYKVKTILYVSRKCKCVSKLYVRSIKCDRKSSGYSYNNYCVDLMSENECEKMKSKGLCKKASLLRDKLCKKTCSRCSVCPKHTKIGFSIKYQSCLVADKKYNGRFKLSILKHILYHDCMMKCKSLSTCKSFDFYLGKDSGLGYCVLNKVNPKQLEIGLYPHPMKLGTTYEDLNKHHSKKCILSIKLCKKRCTQFKVKKLNKCKCSKVKGTHHCYQKSLIYYSIAGHEGRCLKRVWKGLMPCGKYACNNLEKDRKCQLLKGKGKCGNKEVAKKCQKTCTKCKCFREQTYITKCNKTNHKFKISVVTAKHRKHRKCVINIVKEKRSCSICYKKPFRVIHKCKHSVRSVTTVKSVKIRKEVCKVITNNKYYSCSKCPRRDQHFVTSCIKGYLKLITKYSIRIKGCCKFKIDSRQFLCNKCPKKQVRRTHCSEGYRLRHVYYYVRANSEDSDREHAVKCIKRVYTKKEKCDTMRVCRDEMSITDCKLFKKSGGCHQKEADAFRLCKAICGLC